MRKGLVSAALCAALAAVCAAAHPPDTKTLGHAAMARRGSLGADDYVATNVYPCASAYILHTPADGQLRDRAVNIVTVSATNAVFALPARRSVAGFARGFMVSVTATTNSVVTFSGAVAVYSSDGTGEFRIAPGRGLFSFIEIGDREYLAEWRELNEITMETNQGESP